jgi:hypothetical protein
MFVSANQITRWKMESASQFARLQMTVLIVSTQIASRLIIASALKAIKTFRTFSVSQSARAATTATVCHRKFVSVLTDSIKTRQEFVIQFATLNVRTQIVSRQTHADAMITLKST